MDKQILSKLKGLVNNPQQWEAISNYIDALIEQQHKAIEQTDSVVIIHRSQGSIATLRRLKLLRDEVNGQ
jgi:hypothetical protein